MTHCIRQGFFHRFVAGHTRPGKTLRGCGEQGRHVSAAHTGVARRGGKTVLAGYAAASANAAGNGSVAGG